MKNLLRLLREKIEKIKENLRSENEKLEIMRLSSIKSKTLVKNGQKLLSILSYQKKIFFSCVCIKCFKSAKKDTKNMKLKLLTKEDTFGQIEKV